MTGFQFTGDTQGHSYQYRVSIINASDKSVQMTVDTPLWSTDLSKNFGGAPSVELDFKGEEGVSYILEIHRVGGAGHGSNIAVDNLGFSQSTEKVHRSQALLGIGGVTISLMGNE